MAVKVDIEKCMGCGICADVCSVGAITISGRKAYVNDTLCTDCGLCISRCPIGAIAFKDTSLVRKEVDESNNQGHLGQGLGRGYGLGIGRERGYGMGRGRGQGYGRGLEIDRGYSAGRFGEHNTNDVRKLVSDDDELIYLNKQVQELKAQLNELLKRIEELSNKKK